MRKGSYLCEDGNRLSVKLFVFLFFLILPLKSFSITVSKRQYTISDGIGSNTINDIVKDDNGFIWIATTGGITRFDGYNFVNYSNKNTRPFFSSNEVLKLVKKGKFIYLVSLFDGLIKLDTERLTFQTIFSAPMLDIGFQYGITVYLFDNGTLCTFKKNKLLKRRFIPNSSRGNFVIRNSTISLVRPILEKNAISEFDLFTLKEKRRLKIAGGQFEAKCSLGKDGSIVYNTGNEIYRIDKKGNYFKDSITNYIKNASFFIEDNQGKPLAISNRRTAYFSDNEGVIQKYIDKGKNAEFRFIYKLNDQTVFIGSNQGLLKLTVTLNQNDYIDDNSIYNEGQLRVRRKIVESPDGTIYLLGYPGINVFKNNKIIPITIGPSPLFDAIWHDGKLFITTEGDGFFYLDEKNGKIVRIMNKDLKVNDFSFSVARMNDSTLLLGRTNDLLLFNTRSGYTKIITVGFNRNYYTITRGIGPNEFYLGTKKAVERVYISPEGNLTRIAIYLTKQLIIRDILVHSHNELWVGTNKGILILDPISLKRKDIIINASEVSNENIASLIKDNYGRIWAATFGGITIFNQNRKYAMFLTTANKLKNEEYNFKSAALLSDGRLIFGGLNMYDILYPKYIGNNQFKENFIITNVEKISQISKRKQVPFADIHQENISFNTGREELVFQISNFDFAYGADYRFEYRINEAGWNAIESKKAIRISNLPHGHHNLMIRMTNPYGKVMKTKCITIEAKVPFYEQISFIISLSLLSITLSIISTFYYRKFHRVEKETKSRIAMDLHDESGTILTRLLLISESMPNTITQKENLKKGINEALTSIRTFIESMSNPSLTMEELYIDTEEFLSGTLRNTAITYNFIKNSLDKQRISGELYRDIKLCIFETVNNSIRHSNCSHIEICFEQTKKMLTITISDNGNLTDDSTLKFGGNGIRNIRKRTKRNNGELNLNISTGGHGLTVELKFLIK